MGLDLSVGGRSCGRWSYSSFASFRRKIAEQIGIDLGRMQGFYGVDKNIIENKGWEAYEKALKDFDPSKGIPWSTIKDPIVYLLDHSDCDGILAPEICNVLAERLEVIIRDWPDLIPHNGEFYENYDKLQTLRLIEGLRYGAETNQPVEFC